MPRRTIAPTDNPYMWDDVKSYVLKEDATGIALEDNSGYIMLEHWIGTLDSYEGPELSADVIKVRNILRLRRF